MLTKKRPNIVLRLIDPNDKKVKVVYGTVKQLQFCFVKV